MLSRARSRVPRDEGGVRFAVILAATLLPGVGLAAPEPTVPYGAHVLRPDRVFTAEGTAAHAGWMIVVEGERIAAVGPTATIQAPAGAETIDLPGATLLPGLMDLHSHLFSSTPTTRPLWNDQVLKEPIEYRPLSAARHAGETPDSGFTTLRDLGTEGAGFADLSIKQPIEEG
jgi:imidazolonepropionase-like amidohydrolase